MKLRRNVLLKEYTYYKIGGPARFFLEAKSREEILEALDLAGKIKPKRVLFLGLGANLLISDKLFDGLVIRLTSRGDLLAAKAGEDGLVEAFAGESLDRVTRFSFDKGLVGLEWSGGLPSSIGAAVRGNVGAFGGEIKNVLEWADVLDIEDRRQGVKRMKVEELEFSYRESLVKRNPNLLVVAAAFRLRPAAPAQLAEAIEEYQDHIAYRKKNHPLNYPSCGSVFKNITDLEKVKKIMKKWPEIKLQVESRWHGKVPMGYIVQRLGLAGLKAGGAQISPKHANFIVNLGRARFADVIFLIEKVKEAVYQNFHFVPELEVQVVD
jgi:UDP-N-acetylmuramate dehydrogenase